MIILIKTPSKHKNQNKNAPKKYTNVLYTMMAKPKHYPMIWSLIRKVIWCWYHGFLQDGFLGPDEVKKNTELFLSAAKAVREAKKQAESKPSDGRCPHSIRKGKKAKEAEKPTDEKKSEEKDVKDEL